MGEFNTSLWRQLSESDIERIRAICRASIERYNLRLGLETWSNGVLSSHRSNPLEPSFTAPEDQFVCLFSEVFGLEKSQLLVPELGFLDVTGGERRIDYAIKTTEGDVALRSMVRSTTIRSSLQRRNTRTTSSARIA